MLSDISDSIVMIWHAFVQACVRFWDNRYIRNDEVDYLRMEIQRVRGENKRLIDYILIENKEDNEPVDVSNYKPIGKQHVPWAVKRQQLENESIAKLETELKIK